MIGNYVSFLDTVKISLKLDFDERLRLNTMLGIKIDLHVPPHVCRVMEVQ